MASGADAARKSAGIGLDWTGRWGRWADDGIYVVAPCVVDFEVVPVDRHALQQRAIEKALQQIQTELPADAHCINLRHVGPSNDRQLRLRAALVCSTETCESLKPSWQKRVLRGGSFAATLVELSDTMSPKHNILMSNRAAQHSQAESGLTLELPAHWVSHAVPEGQVSVQLPSRSHWYGFANLFGLVSCVDLLRGSDPNRMHLLVDFREADGAQAMFEALSGRFLYNPVNTQIDDTHPATCVVGRYHDLWRTLQGDVSFILHRVGATADKTAGPPAIHINLARKHLVIGREENCDVMLRREHVSKHHATVAIARAAGHGWMLTIQDTSANGTWVNGKRLRPKIVTELHPGDRLTFLPESHEFYKDALMYEVEGSSSSTNTKVRQSTETLVSDVFNKEAATAQAEITQPDTRRRARETLIVDDTDASTSKRHSTASSSAPGNVIVGQTSDDDRHGTSTMPLAAMAHTDARKRRRETPPVNNGVDITSRATMLANVHLAQPVTFDVQDIGVVADNGVVEVGTPDGDAFAQKSASGITSGAARAKDSAASRREDVGQWVRGLDGGSVKEYESTLVSLFDNVSQIRDLYAERLSDFFADTGVEDAIHRLAFATALKQLQKNRY